MLVMRGLGGAFLLLLLATAAVHACEFTHSENLVELDGPTDTFEKEGLEGLYKEGRLEGGDKAFIWTELVNVTLTEDAIVDKALFEGVSFNGPVFGGDYIKPNIIPAGTTISSHLILFDNFDDPTEDVLEDIWVDFGDCYIIGLVFVGPSTLVQNSADLGIAGDFSEAFGLTKDRDSISVMSAEPQKLLLDLISVHEGWDVIRVITSYNQRVENCSCDFLTIESSSGDEEHSENAVEIPFTFEQIKEGASENNDAVQVITETAGGLIVDAEDIFVDSVINVAEDWELDFSASPGSVADSQLFVYEALCKEEDGIVSVPSPGFTVPAEPIVKCDRTPQVQQKVDITNFAEGFNSYLVIYDLAQPKGSPRSQRLTGSIDFGDPIVGIVWNTKNKPTSFVNTNEIFGLPSKDYSLLEIGGRPRGFRRNKPKGADFGWMGLESNDPRSDIDDGDRLWIDFRHPHVLHFDLFVEIGMDVFRVITACTEIHENPILTPIIPVRCISVDFLQNAAAFDLTTDFTSQVGSGLCKKANPLGSDSLLVAFEKFVPELDENIHVDEIVVPGTTYNGPTFPPHLNHVLPAGRYPLVSWLIVLDADVKKKYEQLTVEASIDFNAPIVALVYDHRVHNRLQKTSDVFGKDGISYDKSWVNGLDNNIDSLYIDRFHSNILNLTLFVENGGVDVLRVITACDNAPYSCGLARDLRGDDLNVAITTEMGNPIKEAVAPSDLRLNQEEYDGGVIFQEKVFFPLPEEIGGYAKGTWVSSYILHVDPESKTPSPYAGNFAFDNFVVKCFTTQEELNWSALFAGAPGTQYEQRDAELEPEDDNLILTNTSIIEFDFQAARCMDAARILVRCENY